MVAKSRCFIFAEVPGKNREGDSEVYLFGFICMTALQLQFFCWLRAMLATGIVVPSAEQLDESHRSAIFTPEFPACETVRSSHVVFAAVPFSIHVLGRIQYDLELVRYARRNSRGSAHLPLWLNDQYQSYST